MRGGNNWIEKNPKREPEMSGLNSLRGFMLDQDHHVPAGSRPTANVFARKGSCQVWAGTTACCFQVLQLCAHSSQVSCTLGYKEMVALRQRLLPAAWPSPFASDSLLQDRLPSWPPPLSQVMKKRKSVYHHASDKKLDERKLLL